MSYNCKNYTKQGGDATYIGGSLIFESDSQVTGLDASTTKKGLVKQGASVANAAGTAPTAAEYNALLTSLRNAGIIATE